MVAFGGAGGLFATEVADFLGITTIISPPDPGNLCAFGLHVSDVRRDYIRTIVRRQSAADGGRDPRRLECARRRRPRRHQGRGHRRGADRAPPRRRRPLLRRGPRGPGRHPRPSSASDGGDRAHVEGVPQGPRPHLRLPLRGRAGRRTGQSPRPGGRRAAPAVAFAGDRRRATPAKPFATPAGLLAADRLGRMPALPADGPRLRPDHRRAGDRRGIRLDRGGAAGWTLRVDGYGNLIVEKTG